MNFCDAMQSNSTGSYNHALASLQFQPAKRRRIAFAYEAAIAAPFASPRSACLNDRTISRFTSDPFTYCNGLVYHNKIAYSGQATIIHPNGSIYTGNFQNGLPQGQGTLTCPNGMTITGTVEGSFPDGIFDGTITESKDVIYSYHNGIPISGWYAICYNDGGSYSGEFQNGLPHGQGTRHFEDGSWYVGEFQYGKPHGRGTMCYEDGSTDEGEFLDGCSHGECTRYYPSGEVYKGRMLEGEPSGYGIYHFKDGATYVGEFVRDECCGQGTVTFPTGIQIKGQFFKENLISSDSSAIGDAPFIFELFGLPGGIGNWEGNSLGSITDFMQKNGYAEEAQALIEVYKRLQVEDLTEEAKKIYAALMEDNKSQLLLYGPSDHDMGLNLVPEEDSVIFEFFNSGLGLMQYHAFNGKKFQTMLRVRVPKEALTQDTIWHLLTDQRFETSIDSVYEVVFQLSGAVKLTQEEPIWQTDQCKENCSTEWIFAYLIHKMPRQRYNQLRLQLCEAAIAKAKLNPDPQVQQLLKDNEQLIAEKLERKRKRVASVDIPK